MNNVKQMGLDCIKLMSKRMAGEISMDEYYLALMEMDKKYPMPQREHPLTRDIMRHYKNKVLPMNFKESAEIMMHYKQRIEEETGEKSDGRVSFNANIAGQITKEEWEYRKKKAKREPGEEG